MILVNHSHILKNEDFAIAEGSLVVFLNADITCSTGKFRANFEKAYFSRWCHFRMGHDVQFPDDLHPTPSATESKTDEWKNNEEMIQVEQIRKTGV